jgi:DNA-directed RNA polymerase subunit RPC12/RpoP
MFFKKARLIDEVNRKWEFYCPKCKKFVVSLEHGYSSDYPSEMYLECPECGYRRAVPLQPIETLKEFLSFIRDIHNLKKTEKEQEKNDKK